MHSHSHGKKKKVSAGRWQRQLCLPADSGTSLILSLAAGEQQAALLLAERRQRFPLLPHKRAGDKEVTKPGFDYIRTASGRGLAGSPCPQLRFTILSMLHIKIDVSL